MKNFEIIVGSPVDYEQLVADIRVNGQYLAQVSQENGPDKLLVEFLDYHNIKKINLDLFVSALLAAKEELLKKEM